MNNILSFLKLLITPLTLYMGGGGSSSSVPSKTTQTQITIPPYARPYVEDLLGRTQALTTGAQFEPWNPVDRIQPADPLQWDAYAMAQDMGTSPQFGAAQGMIDRVGQIANQNQAIAGDLQNQAAMYGQMGSHYGDQGAYYGQMAHGYGQDALNYGQAGFRFGEDAARYGREGALLGEEAVDRGQAGFDYGKVGMDYGRLGSMYGDAAYNIANQYRQDLLDPTAIGNYMSPYMQNVMDIQKREAQRDYEMQLPALQQAASAAGAFGGSRHAIMQMQGQRDLMQQLGDIQAIGQQQAYMDALRNMQMGAQMGIEGAGMGIQGAHAGLAGVDRGLSGVRTGLEGYGLGLQGIDTGIRGAQAGMQGAGLGIEGAGMGIQGALGGIQGAGMGIQGAQTGLQGVGQGISAGQLGMQSANALLQGASQLGQLGQSEFGQMMDIMDARQAMGGMMRDYNQQIRDFGYQQFIDELNFPYQQLAFMSDMTQGLPLSQSTIYENVPPQQMGLPQLLGAGMQAYGLANRAEGGLIREPVKKFAEGGLATLGGMGQEPQPAEPLAFDGMHPEEIEAAIAQLSDEQLMQYLQFVADEQALSIIQAELRRRERLRGVQGTGLSADVNQPMPGASGVVPADGLGAVPQTGLRSPDQVEQQVPPPQFQMASGGIVGLKGREANSAAARWLRDTLVTEMPPVEPKPRRNKPKSRGAAEFHGPMEPIYSPDRRRVDIGENPNKRREEYRRKMNEPVAPMTKEEIAAQTKADRKGILAAPTAAFDVLIGGPVNTAINPALEWIINSRAGRALGGGDVNLGRIGSGTATPGWDYMYRGWGDTPEEGQDGAPAPDGDAPKMAQTYLTPDAGGLAGILSGGQAAPGQAAPGQAAPPPTGSVASAVQQSVDSPSTPESCRGYMEGLDDYASDTLQEQMLLDAMRSGLDERRAELAVRENRGKMDALIAAGAAMMQGRNLAEGLQFAGKAGADALREAAMIQDELEDSVRQSELAQQQYELSLMRDNRKMAQDAYHNWMNYDLKNRELAVQYKLGVMKVGAMMQSRSGAAGVPLDRYANAVNNMIKSTPQYLEAKQIIESGVDITQHPRGAELMKELNAMRKAGLETALGLNTGNFELLGVENPNESD